MTEPDPQPNWGGLAPPEAPSPPPPPRRPATWLLVGTVVAGLAAAVTTYNRYSGGDGSAYDSGYAAGAVLGSLILPALLGFALWRFVSPNVGLVVALVVAVGSIAANAGPIAERAETQREIAQAIEDLGLPEQRFEPTREEVACLEESDFDPDDVLTILTDTSRAGSETQLAFFDVVATCAPRALQTDLNVDQFRQSFTAGVPGDVTEDEARCMLGEIVELPTPSDFVTAQDVDLVMGVIEACMTPEAIDALFGGSGTGAQRIGDDPALDRLAERCENGEDIACDVLYPLAPADSEYEAVALDCAGRGLNEAGVACTAGFTDDDGNGFFDTDSTGWFEIFRSCRAGDMLACDFALSGSELGSVGERVGETCGERRALMVGGTCVERYGETAE